VDSATQGVNSWTTPPAAPFFTAPKELDDDDDDDDDDDLLNGADQGDGDDLLPTLLCTGVARASPAPDFYNNGSDGLLRDKHLPSSDHPPSDFVGPLERPSDPIGPSDHSPSDPVGPLERRLRLWVVEAAAVNLVRADISLDDTNQESTKFGAYNV
jgi:hypothetical protein